MMLSLNCLILGQASKKSLTENIGETYEDDSGVVIEFSKFTVCNFKEKLFRREEVKVIVQNTDYYPPKKRRRIIKAQDVPSMTWKEQSEAFKSGLNEPPIIIDNGVYSLDESEFKKFVTSASRILEVNPGN
ncbi:unnamed protein product [Rhizophagus irregularis]|nr:unnamed protein product [Rhizophagus irregularis]